MDSLWYLNATTSGLPVGVKVGAVISSQWETQVLLPWVRKKNTCLWGYRGNSTTQFCGKYKIFTRKPINQQAQSACNNDFNVNLQGWRRRRWGSCSSNPSMQFLHVAMAIFIGFSFKARRIQSSQDLCRSLGKCSEVETYRYASSPRLWGRYFLARAQWVSRPELAYYNQHFLQ